MQGKPHGINSGCSAAATWFTCQNEASQRAHWVSHSMRLNILGELPYRATVPASQAKRSPWWQLMLPAGQTTCQLSPSASWQRGTVSARCQCISTPRNFHNVPTVCRNTLRQRVCSQIISVNDAGEYFVKAAPGVLPRTFDLCIQWREICADIHGKSPAVKIWTEILCFLFSCLFH